MDKTAIHKKNCRYRNVDVYKGIAIICILVHHVFQYFESMRVITRYVTDFHVAMFLFISGYIKGIKNYDKTNIMKDIVVELGVL